MLLGVLISTRRTSLNLTQRELAERAGIPQSNLSNIEKGKQDITVSTLRSIAAALEMPVRDFFEDESSGKKPVVFSRNRIEKLAKAVVCKTPAAKPEDREFVRLFRAVLQNKPNKSVRQVQEAWMRLRQQLEPGQIRAVLARIHDAESRNP